ncbi:MAG: hypothetical protein CMH83_18945 [Nocardioides sp.]|nr:hypothetical protein [Nocardioides sp.]
MTGETSGAAPHDPDGAEAPAGLAATDEHPDPVDDETGDEADQADEAVAPPIPLRPEVDAPLAVVHQLRPPTREPDPEPDTPTAPARPDPTHRSRSRRDAAVPQAPDQTAAGQEVLRALGAYVPVVEEPPSALAPAGPPSTSPGPWSRDTETPTEPPRAPTAREPRARRTRASYDVEEGAGRTTDVEFAPKVLARRVVGLLLLVALVATAACGYLVSLESNVLSIGLLASSGVVVLVLYAARAGSTPMVLAIRSGQLEVRHGKDRDVFDLTSRYTRIEVVGRPGRPGWRVVLGRFGRAPLVIDRSVVDPKAFSDALRRYRPNTPA